jgi:hypothetical protein
MDTDINLSKGDDFPIVNEQIESVGKSAQNYLKQHPVYLIVGIALTIACFALLLLSTGELVIIFTLPLAMLFTGYMYLLVRIQHEFMRQFAAANGFLYFAKGSLDDLDGMLFQIGRKKSVVDVVIGNYNGSPMKLFTYTYVTGEGKSSQTHNYTVFKFHLDANMPDLVLENKNYFFGEPIFQDKTDKVNLELEGDFNKYFRVSVPDGYEIEALQVFTPNIMLDLEEKYRALSMEIVNSHLFIYKNSVIQNRKDLYELYECAKYFKEKLAPVLSRMKPALDDMAEISKK